MTFLCENCQFTNTCGPKNIHPEIVGCCDFGGFDENGNLVIDVLDDDEGNIKE